MTLSSFLFIFARQSLLKEFHSMSHPFPFSSSPQPVNIQLYPDGKYRWIYEFNMLKNPSIIYVVFKIFGGIFLVAWTLMTIHTLIDGGDMSQILEDTKFMFLFCLFFFFLIVVAYLIVAASHNGKYTVIFEMDEEGILHRQMKDDVKKAQAMSWLTVMAGIASGSPTVAGAGILSGTKTSSYSTFSSVRSVKAYRKRHLIKVNELLEKNQVYVDDEDFDFVYQYILSRCPKAQK